MPIVADIHFHYKRALEAADAGAACLASTGQHRFGRAGPRSHRRGARQTAAPSASASTPAAERRPAREIWRAVPEAGRKRARPHPHSRGYGFRDYKVAVKASDLFLASPLTSKLADQVDARFTSAVRCRRPHWRHGQVGDRNGALLWPGLATPIACPCRRSPRKKSASARAVEIARIRNRGVRVVSCPSCARQGFDVHSHRRGAGGAAAAHPHPDVAVGTGLRRQRTGEARETDIGITGGGNGNHMSICRASPITNPGRGMIDHIVRLVEARRPRSKRRLSRPHSRRRRRRM